MKEKKELIRKIKFTIFSISAGLIQVALFTLLYELISWNYWVSYLIALIASVIWNFTLNREYTFKSAGNVKTAMFKVFLFYLVFTPLSTIAGHYLENTLKWNGFIVLAITMICNFVLEYIYQKYYVFKGTIDTKERIK